MARRRVCFSIPNLAGGGAERVAIQVAAALDPSRFDVTLLVQERWGPLVAELPPGLRVRFLHDGPYRRAHLPASLLGTIREARRHDVVVAANEGRAAMAALLAARATGRRALAWVHVSWRAFGAEVSWRQRLALRLYGRFDGVVAVSRGVGDDLAAIVPAAARRLVTIPNPVDLEAIARAAARPVEPAHAALFDRPVVLAAGRLVPQKDHATLVAAHALLRARGLDHRLVILGEGPLRADLLAQAEALGVADTVALAGFVAEPARYMARAACLALPSRFEGFGIVLAEAMAAGAPVVATDCPHGPREALDDGRAGLLVPVGDPEALAQALGSVLADPARAGALREAGRARARDFSQPALMARWEALLLDEGASGGAGGRGRGSRREDGAVRP
jgi:glycosyltransferase involved in cell wall biosynthesis